MVCCWAFFYSASASPSREHNVIFDLNHRPLHMSDVVLSLLNGTHNQDKRTEQLKPEESLSKLQLSTPCGWFWHSPTSVRPEKTTFLDRNIGPLSQTQAFALPLTIVQYEDPIELQQHKVFGNQVPAFNSLDSLTPHAWNFVRALNGDPHAVSLESSTYPGYYVHHYLSPPAVGLSAVVMTRSYQVMMSHHSHIADSGDATWQIGNAFGRYNIPVMVGFKTVNIPQEHHIVHICVEDDSGELQCSLKLAPRKDAAVVEAQRKAAEKAKLQAAAKAKPQAASVDDDSGSENIVEKAVHLLEGVLPNFVTSGVEHQDTLASSSSEPQQASARSPGFAVASEQETHMPQAVSEDEFVPDVKDFDNAAAFYVHSV